LRALAATWRVRFEGPDPLAASQRVACLAAVWHRNILIGAGTYRDLGLTVAISRSRDGDLVSSVVERLGWAPPPRGSSSRGASAVFLELLRSLRAGAIVVMLCDGPRGPARHSKSGVVHLARSSGVPIIPLGFFAQPCTRFSSWDETLLPWPFARVVVRYGDPIAVPADANDDAVEVIRQQLDDVLNRLTDDLWGAEPAPCAR